MSALDYWSDRRQQLPGEKDKWLCGTEDEHNAHINYFLKCTLVEYASFTF